MSLDATLPEQILERADQLRSRAQAFVSNGHDPTPELSANKFCRECAENDDVQVIERLLAREGRVLRQRGRDVIPGTAFRGLPSDISTSARSEEEDGAETAVDDRDRFPEGISHRVRNLFLLNVDLRGAMNSHLGKPLDNDGGPL